MYPFNFGVSVIIVPFAYLLIFGIESLHENKKGTETNELKVHIFSNVLKDWCDFKKFETYVSYFKAGNFFLFKVFHAKLFCILTNKLHKAVP